MRPGPPATALLEQVTARQIELVVLSTHGRSGLARRVWGSVAEQVACRAPVPVLLLPAAAPVPLTAGATMLPRLLVPLDQSARAEAALPLALALAQVLEAEVRLLGVLIPRSAAALGSETRPAWEVARRRLHEAEQSLLGQVQAAQQTGVRVHWSLGYGLPGAKIIAEAHRQQVHLIVLPTEGGGGPGRFGRVAEAVLQEGQWPVLLVPAAVAAPDPPKEDRSAERERKG